MTPAYTFEVAGKPKAKGRPRFGNGRTWTPETTTAAESAVKAAAEKAGVEMISGAVAMHIEATFEPPKSWRKARRAEAIGCCYTSKPDADNISKLVKDALNNIAYADDSQVTDLAVRKRYGETAKTTVTVWPVEWARGLE